MAYAKNKQDEVVFALETLALLNALKKKNRFAVKAFRNAASIVDRLDNFHELYRSGQLKQVKGIGKAVMAMVDNVMAEKNVVHLDFPIGLLEVAELPSVGLARAITFYHELGIRKLRDLKKAIDSRELLNIKGIGEKTQTKIATALDLFEQTRGKLRLDQALALAETILSKVLQNKRVTDASVVGDLRRGCEIVTSIDILVIGKISNIELKSLLLGLRATEISDIAHIFRGKSGVLKNGTTIKIFKTIQRHKGIAQILLTGNDSFLEAIKNRTGQNFLALKSLDAPTEKEAFLLLNLPFIPPELRENDQALVKRSARSVKLIELKDLRGTFHNHTTASDGRNSILEMRAAAIKRGLSYISINDHSRSAFYAGGQSEKALLQQLKEIKQINLDAKACFVLSGVESDILSDGSLDYDDEILSQLDIVVASVHSQLKMDSSNMTNRMIKAASNPMTTIIGHPTGRRLLKRAESSYDLSSFFEECKKYDVAIELNAHPERLDLSDRHLAVAKSCGVLIAIDTDAHSLRGLDFLEYGIMVARRAHLT